MRDGFIRAAVTSVKVKVADPAYNKEKIMEMLQRAEERRVRILVLPDLVLAAEVCEDLWVPLPPSTYHALAGATVICNPSASDEVTTKEQYRRSLVSNQSARLICAYLYASAGEGESTQDFVYSGHHLIAENGAILAESCRFINEWVETEIDVQRLVNDRTHPLCSEDSIYSI